MGLEKTVEKLDKYFERYERGKARKIKPAHVDKAIRKLQVKEELLLAEISETDKESKIDRLNRKLDLVREQQSRAVWLKSKIGVPRSSDS